MTTPILEMTEDEVHEALNGNEGLFNQLIHINRRRLMVVLQRNGTSANDIEDCAQHACMRLWEYRGKVQPHSSAIFSWLCTTALRRASDMQRKSYRFEFIWDYEIFDTLMGSVEDAFPDEDRIPKLRAAIATLEEPYQKIIRMQLAGRSYEEMAQILNCPINTIGTRRSKAVAMLKKEYKKYL